MKYITASCDCYYSSALEPVSVSSSHIARFVSHAFIISQDKILLFGCVELLIGHTEFCIILYFQMLLYHMPYMAKHSRGNTFVVRIENEHSRVKFCGSSFY